MIESIEGKLKEIGYTGVKLVETTKNVFVKAAKKGEANRMDAVPQFDLHVSPAQNNQVVGPEWQFVALGILDAAGITYEKGGVRVFNGALIIPDLSNTQKPAAAAPAK
jgi:hypothetical protein